MALILASSLTLTPRNKESNEDAYKRAESLIWNAIVGHIRGPVPDTHLHKNTEVTWSHQDAAGAMRLHWKEWRHPCQHNTGVTRCKFTYPRSGDEWEVDLTIGITQDTTGVELSAVWNAPANHGTRFPFPQRPGLLGALEKEDCYSTNLALPFRLQKLREEDIERFCHNIVYNPKRTIPIVLISPEKDSQQVLLDGDTLAQRLFGLAVVYQFANTKASTDFKDRVGTRWACYDGAVRLYPPQNRDCQLAHYQIARKIREEGVQATIKWVVQEAAEASLRYHSVLESHRNLEQLQREDEQHRWQEMIARLTRTESDNQELEKLWNEHKNIVSERNILAERNRELERRIRQLEDELETEKRNLQDLMTWSSSSPAQPEEPIASHQPSIRLLLSRQAGATYTNASPSQREEFLHELRKLRSEPQLRQRNSKRINRKKSDCNIYPQGDNPGVRLFFYEQDHTIYVCELADHRDKSYEHLIDDCTVFKQNYPLETFRPFDGFEAENLDEE